jgi:hypothetical protein
VKLLLLTPWSRVLLEKLTGLQLVKKFLAFYGAWRFLTALTSARHLSLSWASPIQSSHPHPTSWRSILTLSPAKRRRLSGLQNRIARFEDELSTLPFLQILHRRLDCTSAT